MIGRSSLAAIILLMTSNAFASSWQVRQATDRMTDKKETWLVLQATPFSRMGTRVTPYIQIHCHRGRPYPELKFSVPVDWGRVGVNYRFDAGEVHPLYISFLNDGMTFPIFLGREDAMSDQLKNGKRLRLEIFFTGQNAQFIEFDLTGGRDAFSNLGC